MVSTFSLGGVHCPFFFHTDSVPHTPVVPGSPFPPAPLRLLLFSNTSSRFPSPSRSSAFFFPCPLLRISRPSPPPKTMDRFLELFSLKSLLPFWSEFDFQVLPVRRNRIGHHISFPDAHSLQIFSRFLTVFRHFYRWIGVRIHSLPLKAC